MQLNTITDNRGSSKKRKRVGRGIGSSKGKTCGRGHKGQKSRTGVSVKGFEGGQMPIHMRMPKRGFKPINPRRYQELSLERLAFLIDKGKLSKDEVITADLLKTKGCIKHCRDGVRLIGRATLPALRIGLTSFSSPARKCIEDAGGTFV